MAHKIITEHTKLRKGDKEYVAHVVKKEISHLVEGIAWVDLHAHPINGEFGLSSNPANPVWFKSIGTNDGKGAWKIIATYGFDLEGVPRIELEDEVEKAMNELNDMENETHRIFGWTAYIKLTFDRIRNGYKANKAEYTKEQMGAALIDVFMGGNLRNEEAPVVIGRILESLNTIQEIEVDEQFKIINIKN